MKFLKAFLNFFTSITTAITAVLSVVVLVSGYEGLSPFITLQILSAGAITALLTAAVYSVEFRSKKHFLIMTAVHYVLLCITMAVLGAVFGWTGTSVPGIVMMCIYVAVVYIIVYAITYVLMKKEADKLNRALNERNRKG